MSEYQDDAYQPGRRRIGDQIDLSEWMQIRS